MGDDTRQDEPGMKPDGIRLRVNDDGTDDTEGHGGGKWAGAKDETTDTEGHGGGWWNGARDEKQESEPLKDDDVEGHRARS